jgi:hypothetical protein
LGRWDTKKKTAKATHVKIEIGLPCAATKGLESAGATERALGRWDTKKKTAKATHVKIEICLACALFNGET